MKCQTLIQVAMVFFMICCTHSSTNAQLPHACYMFGDRHLIPFPKQPTDSQAQYQCSKQGTQTLICNDYVCGTITVTTNPSWNQDFRFNFFDNTGNIICKITAHNSICDDPSNSITTVCSFNSIDIYYRYSSTEDLRIGITHYSIGYNKTVYDIQVMQYSSLMYRSNGLCRTYNQNCQLESNIRGSRSRAFTATPAAYVCSIFLNEAYDKTKELGLPVSSKFVSHAKTACIKDLRVSHNKAYAKSMIILLLRDGLYRKTMNNTLNEKEFATMLKAILKANENAYQIAVTEIVK